MPDVRHFEDHCVKDYRKYSDTVAVSYSIYHILTSILTSTKFVGIEHKLVNADGQKVRPDVVALYGNDTKGLIFELKWSLPLNKDLLEKEIKEIKKYTVPCSGWSSNVYHVDSHDVVLICHIDDVYRVVETIKELAQSQDYSFLKQEGFAVWFWTITPPKLSQRKEELRLFPAYGKTRNTEIENAIQAAGGLLIPDVVLTYLRFSFTFVREKPPPQYTMTVLIQNVFPTFQQKPERDNYQIDINLIYERAKVFFPSWHEFDTETIQVKRRWIREALEKLWELKLAEKVLGQPDLWYIPIPTLRTRRPIQEVLCKKISKQYIKELKKQRPRPTVRKPRLPKVSKKQKPITDFFKT